MRFFINIKSSNPTINVHYIIIKTQIAFVFSFEQIQYYILLFIIEFRRSGWRLTAHAYLIWWTENKNQKSTINISVYVFR